MSTRRRSVGDASPALLIGLVSGAALVVTVMVVVLPLRFAYRAPALHAVLETVNALVALLVAYLVLGRYRTGRRLQELLLIAGLVVVAVANLLLTALPTAIASGGERAAQWDSLIVRLLGAVLIAAAALCPPGIVVDATARWSRWALAGAGGAVLVALVVLRAVYLDRLPAPVEGDVPLDRSVRPLVTGHPLVLGAQVVGLLLYVAAAVAFTRQALRTRDELLRWLAVHCALAGTARVHYLLFPSLHSDYVYTGDVLRLAAYGLLLAGAAREIQSYWQARTLAAVLEDRRRLARDLHDGLTQELTYIWSQSRLLVNRPGDVEVADRINGASARAIDEARTAIAALTRTRTASFATVLRESVDGLAGRYGARAEVVVDDGVELTPEQGDGVLRIVAEAFRNAVRHGGASCVRVTLDCPPLVLTVADDGQGFDPCAAKSAGGGFGLTSMRERAEGLGAGFALHSTVGAGTTVEVRWQ